MCLQGRRCVMKKAFIITVSLLAVVVMVLGVYLFQTNTVLGNTSANLENLYQRSFYDLVNNVNNMEVGVSKLMITSDSASQQKLMSELKQQTSDAEDNLSLLPLEIETVAETTKFMNHLNGYCTSLITYKDGKMEANDLKNMNKIHLGLKQIKEELNEVSKRIMAGARISDNMVFGRGKRFSDNFTSLTADTIEFPSLIYDGPFSESTESKIVKGLPDNILSQEECEQKVVEALGEITELTPSGETNGVFETYDFVVKKDNLEYFVQVTKRGGFVLTISANVSGDGAESSSGITLDEEASSPKEYTKVAEEFAKKLGLQNMQCVWSASSDEIAYVNLAPVEDDIILYPDLIKAKVYLNTMQVVGWEASSYAYNHHEREDMVAQLTKTEARKLVSSELNVDSQKLCVIPLDYVGETLAYEFAGTYDNYQYYLYIDAYTGDQVRVLRVVQTDQGNLIM